MRAVTTFDYYEQHVIAENEQDAIKKVDHSEWVFTDSSDSSDAMQGDFEINNAVEEELDE